MGDAKNNPNKAYLPFVGPTPPGEYLLGYPVDVSEAHQVLGDLMWLPIINPETMDDKVFVKDPKGNSIERNMMFLHAGTESEGCITFPNKDNKSGHIGSSDFSELKDMLMNTKPLMRLTPNRNPIVQFQLPSRQPYPGRLIVR